MGLKVCVVCVCVCWLLSRLFDSYCLDLFGCVGFFVFVFVPMVCLCFESFPLYVSECAWNRLNQHVYDIRDLPLQGIFIDKGFPAIRGYPFIRHSTLQEFPHKEGGAKPRAGESIILRTMCPPSNMEMVL